MADTSGGQSRYIVLVAMILEAAMAYIDQTIASVAVPKRQTELGLASSCEAESDVEVPT